jgi:hypothetical protein
MDDEFCQRFYKRLKLSDRDAFLPCDDTAAVPIQATPVPQCAAYVEVNGFLRGLHTEQIARRHSLSTPADMEREPIIGSGTAAVSSTSDGSGLALTHFTLADVVQCGHGAGGRCLQCSGRLVENVPLAVYSVFSRAYSAATSSSSTSPFPQPGMIEADRSRPAVELSFPAFVALASCLRPEPGERLLHLGSGTGRAVLTWSLLLPQAASCGVEKNFAMHRVATVALSQLETSIQQRVFLQNCDIFSVQGDWCQANIIILSAVGFDTDDMARVVDGLSGASSGTRVVCFSQPLLAGHSGAPAGFELAKKAAYRTVSSGNATVYIYRKT